MAYRKSTLFCGFISLGAILLGAAFLHAVLSRKADTPSIMEKKELVETLGLTDLCLFTDARYTRHLSMADLNTPFQDYPMSFEHFPSGSIMTSPSHLRPQTESREHESR